MISLEEAAAELDEIADNIPNEFFIQLNGGICILPDIKYHPELPSGRYFILWLSLLISQRKSPDYGIYQRI